ncbi:MAG: hypothetical protein JRD89_12215 [Deltaproteobacteria bacterium]|nr:hypothetical protein [Deltaproteobacteria bacterium]
MNTHERILANQADQAGDRILDFSSCAATRVTEYDCMSTFLIERARESFGAETVCCAYLHPVQVADLFKDKGTLQLVEIEGKLEIMLEGVIIRTDRDTVALVYDTTCVRYYGRFYNGAKEDKENEYYIATNSRTQIN